jgi:hypothetical protein
MRKIKVNISLIGFVMVILISVLVGALILSSFLLVGSLKVSDKDYIGAVVGSIGNIIGGVIGGIVAYIVAAYQVNKTHELERSKGESNSYATLRLVKVELESNIRILEGIKDQYFSGKKDSLKYVSLDNWEKCSILIGKEVNDDTIRSVSSIYNKFRVIKSHSGTLDQQTYDQLLRDADNTIKEIEKELQKLSK